MSTKKEGCKPQIEMGSPDKNFGLYGAAHEFEAKLIGRALGDSGGSVTKAARLLGLSHQTLIAVL